jgi:tetratricopeptide (TPR) repeat protein
MRQEEILAAIDGLLATERWAEIVAAVEPRLEEEPLGHALLFRLGWACLELGRHADAARYLQQAIDAGPPVPAYFASMGMALLELGEFDFAELWLLRALALRDTHVARGALALCYERQGFVDLAEGVLRQGLALHPGDARLVDALADLLRDGGREEEAAALKPAVEPACP